MKVMVLAAGRGNRLRPFTDRIPKPILPVAGKPLVAYQLEALARAGFTEVVMNVAYKAELIMQTLGDGQQYGVNLQYSIEEEGGLETGGGIVKALPLLGERFLVVSADVYTDFPYESLRDQPEQLAHLVMVDPLANGGDFALIDGKMRVSAVNKLTYANVGVFHRNLFNGCKVEFFRLASIWPAPMERGQITGEYFQGQWINVGEPETYQLVQNLFD